MCVRIAKCELASISGRKNESIRARKNAMIAYTKRYHIRNKAPNEVNRYSNKSFQIAFSHEVCDLAQDIVSAQLQCAFLSASRPKEIMTLRSDVYSLYLSLVISVHPLGMLSGQAPSPPGFVCVLLLGGAVDGPASERIERGRPDYRYLHQIRESKVCRGEGGGRWVCPCTAWPSSESHAVDTYIYTHISTWCVLCCTRGGWRPKFRISWSRRHSPSAGHRPCLQSEIALPRGHAWSELYLVTICR